MTGLALAEKHCKSCGETKPLSAFYRNRARRDGRTVYCAVCVRAQVDENTARRRAELGEEAWLAYTRESVRRSRERNGMRADRRYSAAARRATQQLRDAHRVEYDALLARARYDLEHEEEEEAS